MEMRCSSVGNGIDSKKCERKSCMQWMEEYFQSKKQLDALNTIHVLAIRLGARLSRNVLLLMFFMCEGKEMAAKFQNFRRSVSEAMAPNPTIDCKSYAVKSRFTRLLEIADQELDKVKQKMNEKLRECSTAVMYYSICTGLYEDANYGSIGQVLDQLFFVVISKMEAILSYPYLPESHALMYTKLPIVVEYLKKLETILDGMERKINRFGHDFTDLVVFADSTINDFLNVMEPKINQVWNNLGLPEGEETENKTQNA